MKNLIKKISNYSYSFLFLNVYIFLTITVPKSLPGISVIPFRTMLTFMLIAVVIYDLYNKNIIFESKKHNLMLTFYLMFLIFSLPSLMYTKNLIVSLYTIIKFLGFLLLFIICLSWKLSKEEYFTIVKTFALSTIVVLFLGIFQYTFDYNLFKVGVEKYAGAKGRISSTFFNTIYYGIYINIVFWYVMYFYYTSKTKIRTIFFGLIGVLLFSSLILTFTRSSILVFVGIAAIITILYNNLLLNKRVLIIVIAIGTTALFIPGFYGIVDSAAKDGIQLMTKFDILEKFLPNFSDSDIDNNQNDNYDFDDLSLEHRQAFAIISNKIANDNIFHGVGFGSYIDYMNSNDFDLRYPEYNLSKTHPHSTLVLMFAETSIFSLLCFIIFSFLIVLRSLKYIVHGYKTKDASYGFAVLSFSVSLGFTIVNVIAENAVYDSQIFALFLIIMGLTFNKIATIKSDLELI